MLKNISNNDGLHGYTVKHAADAELCIGHSDLHVALVAPVGTPRVPHDEVVNILSIIVAPANSLNGMINISRAGCIIIDS